MTNMGENGLSWAIMDVNAAALTAAELFRTRLTRGKLKEALKDGGLQRCLRGAQRPPGKRVPSVIVPSIADIYGGANATRS